MLDQESEGWRKSSELRKADELWNPKRWVVLIIFLMSWCAWFLRISRHWELWDRFAAVGLLSLSPIPCILMFFRREAYPPLAAFLTYMLLGLAFGVAIGRG